jgi:hypothetical protein
MLLRMPITILAVIMSVQSIAAHPAEELFHGLTFMAGHWTGEGTGAPGNSVGGFSFEWDLQKNILIRKSFAEYPATPDHPASRHDDLMVALVEDACSS